MRAMRRLAMLVIGMTLVLGSAYTTSPARAQQQAQITASNSSRYLPIVERSQLPMVMPAEITLPPPITALDMGTTKTGVSDCRVADPLADPVVLPEGSTSFAFQLTRSVPNSARISVSITPGFGGPTRSTNCNDYVVVNGQVYQNKLGAQVELLDGAPLPAGDYKLVITVNSTITEVPFTIPAATQPTNTISGTVRDAGGNPLAGAEVSASQSGQAPVSTQTAADGSYRLEVPAGTYSVVVVKAGYAPVLPLNVSVPPDRIDVNFALTPASFGNSFTVYLPFITKSP